MHYEDPAKLDTYLGGRKCLSIKFLYDMLIFRNTLQAMARDGTVPAEIAASAHPLISAATAEYFSLWFKGSALRNIARSVA